MRWVEVMEAVLAHLAADPALDGVSLERWGEFDQPSIPSVSWLVFSDQIEELTNPIRAQFDIFANGIDQALAIEEAIRGLHGDTPQTIQGVLMLAQLDDARGDADPAPGVIHRSLDFNFTPARERAG